MIIENHTEWKTEDLRRLFSECCDRIGIEKAHRVVKVFYRRTHSDGIDGRAFLFSDRMTIKLPNMVWTKGTDGTSELMKLETLDSVELAQVFMHEAHHNLGLTHEDMVDHGELDADWATPFIINRAKKGAVPRVDRPNLRYQNILNRIDEKKSKIKRLENALKKLLRRKSYYEKRLKG